MAFIRKKRGGSAKMLIKTFLTAELRRQIFPQRNYVNRLSVLITFATDFNLLLTVSCRREIEATAKQQLKSVSTIS